MNIKINGVFLKLLYISGVLFCTGFKSPDKNYILLNQNYGIDDCYTEFYYKFYTNKVKLIVEDILCKDVILTSNTLQIENLKDCSFGIRTKREYANLSSHKIAILNGRTNDTLVCTDLIFFSDTLKPEIGYTSLGPEKRVKGTINAIDSIYCRTKLNTELNNNYDYLIEEFELTTISRDDKQTFKILGTKVPSDIRKILGNIQGPFDIIVSNVKVKSLYFNGIIDDKIKINIFR